MATPSSVIAVVVGFSAVVFVGVLVRAFRTAPAAAEDAVDDPESDPAE